MSADASEGPAAAGAGAAAVATGVAPVGAAGPPGAQAGPRDRAVRAAVADALARRAATLDGAARRLALQRLARWRDAAAPADAGPAGDDAPTGVAARGDVGRPGDCAPGGGAAGSTPEDGGPGARAAHGDHGSRAAAAGPGGCGPRADHGGGAPAAGAGARAPRADHGVGAPDPARGGSAARADLAAAGTAATPAAAAPALAELSALVDRLGRGRGADPALPARTAPPPLKSVAAFAGALSRLRAEQRVRQAQATVPANAGPLNSSRVVHRALQALGEIAPAYLERLTAQIDALMAIERQAGGDARLSAQAARPERALPGGKAPARGRSRSRSATPPRG